MAYMTLHKWGPAGSRISYRGEHRVPIAHQVAAASQPSSVRVSLRAVLQHPPGHSQRAQPHMLYNLCITSQPVPLRAIPLRSSILGAPNSYVPPLPLLRGRLCWRSPQFRPCCDLHARSARVWMSAVWTPMWKGVSHASGASLEALPPKAPTRQTRTALASAAAHPTELHFSQPLLYPCHIP